MRQFNLKCNQEVRIYTQKQSIHIGFGCESNHSVSFLLWCMSDILFFNNRNVTDAANGCTHTVLFCQVGNHSHGRRQVIFSLFYSFYFHVFYSLFCYILNPIHFIAHFYLCKINCYVFSANCAHQTHIHEYTVHMKADMKRRMAT